MFLSVRHSAMVNEARKYRVVDRDTGKEIPRVVWANDETGRYRQLLIGDDGRFLLNERKDAIQSRIFSGKIKLVKVQD